MKILFSVSCRHVYNIVVFINTHIPVIAIITKITVEKNNNISWNKVYLAYREGSTVSENITKRQKQIFKSGHLRW